jgi:hypothetical protein
MAQPILVNCSWPCASTSEEKRGIQFMAGIWIYFYLCPPCIFEESYKSVIEDVKIIDRSRSIFCPNTFDANVCSSS